MEFGLVYDFRNATGSGLSDAQNYRRTLDHIVAAEALGFDTIWLTEHHFTDDAYLPSLLTMAAAVAVRTTRVTIGTAVLLLPLHHPLRVAEDVAVVDNLSDGRFRLGVGAGYVHAEFEAFGIDRQRRGRLVESGVAVIREAFDRGLVTPKPVQARLPIWLGARAEVTARRAGRIGDGVLISPDKALIETFQAARAGAGHVGRGEVGAFAYVYPSQDASASAASLGTGVAYRFNRYVDWYGAAGDLPGDRTGGTFDPRLSFADPDVVTSQLRRLQQMGVTSVMWFATLPGLPPEATLPLLETLISVVRPALKG
jgi:alkanesulfonate monooxygenase SsuD/methylene tetrahydromethanopterin reductase-like flavin-dependent oxidoreductase (luciferase family)